MDLRARFAQFADDFDRTVEDDDWSRIRVHFAEDAIRQENEPPLIQLRLEGIENVIAQWQEMVERFDRRFDRRILVRTGPVEQAGNIVSMPWVGIYLVEGTPALLGEGREFATYEGDRIQLLRTTWVDGTAERMMGWAAAYGSRVPGLLEYSATLAAGEQA